MQKKVLFLCIITTYLNVYSLKRTYSNHDISAFNQNSNFEKKCRQLKYINPIKSLRFETIIDNDTNKPSRQKDTINSTINYTEDDETFFCGGPSFYHAEFPGGDDSLLSFFEKHLIFPCDTSVKGSFTCHIRFKITIEGKVDCITLSETSGHKEMDLEAIRVIALMPKWEPAKKLNNQPFDYFYTFPITFEN